MTNVSHTIEESQEDAPTLFQAISPVVFHQDAPAFSPSVLTRVSECPTLQAFPTPPMQPQHSTRPPLPTPSHQRPSGVAKKIQISHNQQMVKPCHPVRPPTQTVMSCWWQVLDGVNATQIMSSWPKNYPQARPTLRTSQGTPENWKQWKRSHRDRLTQSHDQQCFYPKLTSSTFRSFLMQRPNRRKNTKTMAPRWWSTPSLPRRTHPRKTPWSPQPSLRHAHALRPETPISKRKRETSHTSAC